jgi:hypothetical protein
MKEQLAKMTIIELVRTAHSYSTSIKQTGVYSELVREMASRLEALNLALIGAMAALSSTQKDRDQLAAECAALNEKMNTLATWPGIEFYSLAWEFNNSDGDTALEFMCDVQTPATDRFLAEQRAQGVEMFADRKNKELFSLHPDTHAIGSIAAAMSAELHELREFAAKLRDGEVL